MNADNMTADELYALAQQKAGSAQEVREMDVDGLAVKVYPHKANSWKAYRILREAMGAGDDMARFDAMLALVTLATDVDEERIIEHCGGEEAQTPDVVRIVSEIVAGCYPKN